MNTTVSRFLSFEETLGAGLVKFAYFVLLAVLFVLMVIAMIAGVVAMFTSGFWAGLGQVLIAPLQFVIALILLRVGTEVVLAILSIDDQLTDGARLGAATALGQDRRDAVPAPQPAAARTAPAATGTAKAPAKKTTKKAAKSTKSTARAKADTKPDAKTGSAPSTKKTAEAAKAATRPAAQDDAGAKSDGSSSDAGPDTKS